MHVFLCLPQIEIHDKVHVQASIVATHLHVH